MIRLVDLRGINLSGITLKKTDLTYCCFDDASFESTRLEEVLLQFSTFARTRLDHAIFDRVQASPIYLKQGTLNHATILESFFDSEEEKFIQNECGLYLPPGGKLAFRNPT